MRTMGRSLVDDRNPWWSDHHRPSKSDESHSTAERAARKVSMYMDRYVEYGVAGPLNCSLTLPLD